MRIWHCKYDSLRGLSSFPNLSTLVIATFPDADLEVLGTLSKLRYLEIVNLPHITSLAPVRTLRDLEVLRLHTLPSWDSSGKKTVVESLTPVAALPRLRHLELFGVVPRDGSLRELEGLPSLQTARFHKYAKKETERFYEATGHDDSFAPEPAEGFGA